ncbi:hypothetical protein [Aliiroseovarius subalbicans]|uniref:hypothetical protein n=1 Tax=Aliiroseovarius subalbicans TaxID=2925840 RepID=UPI001F58F09C|nr:hypothetical protein [Aliiroseovarius subalbicans]MCI2399412.1 hypothetical protein [Aliiroseovarius subalbicans]
MRHLIFAALIPLTLAACTPQQNCEARVRHQISDIDAQIDEVRDNLRRGYAYLPVRTNVRVGVQFCATPGGTLSVCTGTDTPSYRRVSIDPAAERAKLAALQKRQVELQRDYAQCAATYPSA